MKTKHEELKNSQIDNYSNFIGNIDHIKGWFVFLSQSRDSDLITRNNFKVALNELGGESKSIQVHRFGHWGCGWFEQILINPENTEAVNKAERIQAALSDYPLLDESDYYNELHNEINEYWDNLTLSDKIDLCKQCHESIFSCRYVIPERVYNHLSDLCAE